MISQKQWYSILSALLIARDVYKVPEANKAIRWVKKHIKGWPKG